MTSDAQTPIQELKDRIAVFNQKREWDQFHSPKNLSIALAVEAAEVMELFQWKTDNETAELRGSPAAVRRVREEIADVGIYLLNLCNRLGIDLAAAIVSKLSQNERKYPVALAKGTSTKYNELRSAARNVLPDAEASAWRQLELGLEEVEPGSGDVASYPPATEATGSPAEHSMASTSIG